MNVSELPEWVAGAVRDLSARKRPPRGRGLGGARVAGALGIALMAFSPEDDNTVRLWQLPSGNALATLHNDGGCARSSRATPPYPQRAASDASRRNPGRKAGARGR